MADAKSRNVRGVVLGLLALAGVWLLGVWPPPLWWRDHWPRETAMMRRRAADLSIVPSYHPTAIKDISPLLQRMVIIGEDSRFHSHHGLDFAEMADAIGLGGAGDRGVGTTARAAWRHRDRIRGASTITQQLAKNLYLSPSRSPLRKLKEAVTALRLELALSKDRILELYLSVAEWGSGIWGIDAASRGYFGVAPSRLTAEQAATLAATLPQPRSSNPMLNPERMLARRDLILARYHGVDVYIPPIEEVDDSLLVPPPILPIAVPVIPPVVESLLVDTVKPIDTTKVKADST